MDDGLFGSITARRYAWRGLCCRMMYPSVCLFRSILSQFLSRIYTWSQASQLPLFGNQLPRSLPFSFHFLAKFIEPFLFPPLFGDEFAMIRHETGKVAVLLVNL